MLQCWALNKKGLWDPVASLLTPEVVSYMLLERQWDARAALNCPWGEAPTKMTHNRCGYPKDSTPSSVAVKLGPGSDSQSTGIYAYRTRSY